MIVSSGVDLRLGDCLDVLPTLAENSVDTIITDPPYGLQFMGKDWDHGVPGERFWRECLRVAKPGALLLAFGGTRTWHRLAVAIEDAGWEIRDTIVWMYGSGFPKSHDISKAIDREAGAEREVVGVKPGHDNFIGRSNHPLNGGWDRPWASDPLAVERYHSATAPATPEAQQWDGWGTALKPAWEPVIVAQAPLDGTYAANALKHGVAGMWIDGARIPANGGEQWEQEPSLCDSCAEGVVNQAKHTAPATRASSVAGNANQTMSGRAEINLANMSKTDTGCSDGTTGASTDTNSSIGASGKMPTGRFQEGTLSTTSTGTKKTIGSAICSSCGAVITSASTNGNTPQTPSAGQSMPGASESPAAKGRWPSNVLLDPDAAKALDEMSGELTSGTGAIRLNKPGLFGLGGDGAANVEYGDSGGASRFFYCAKASRAERNAGLEGMAEHSPADITGRKPGSSGLMTDSRGNPIGNPYAGVTGDTPRQNHHPTVKPLDLMRYLCELTRTPTGGVVLDPFMGSGTTGMACALTNRDFIGIELDPEYLEIARRRIDWAQRQNPDELFEQPKRGGTGDLSELPLFADLDSGDEDDSI